MIKRTNNRRIKLLEDKYSIIVVNPLCGTMTLQTRMRRIRTFVINLVLLACSSKRRFSELEKIPICLLWFLRLLEFRLRCKPKNVNDVTLVPARWCSGYSNRFAVGRLRVHSLSRVIPKDFKKWYSQFPCLALSIKKPLV